VEGPRKGDAEEEKSNRSPAREGKVESTTHIGERFHARKRVNGGKVQKVSIPTRGGGGL